MSQQAVIANRKFTLQANRKSLMLFFFVFGHVIAVYPFWLLNRNRKKFSYVKTEVKKINPASPTTYDRSLSLGLFAIDFLPYVSEIAPAQPLQK